jgi:hypothetical protein
MHCIVWIIIIYDLLFNWDDIYLYLVIANKISTNLIWKQCSALTIFLGKPFATLFSTLPERWPHESSHLL